MEGREEAERWPGAEETGLPPLKRTCPNCGAEIVPVFDPNRGEYYCPICGYVFEEEVIDPGRHWRSFTMEQEISRATAEKLRRNSDTTPKEIRLKHKRGFVKLKDRGVRDRYEKEIDKIGKRLNLPDYIVEDVKRIFFEARKMGLLRGRSFKAFVAAAIYVASKRHRGYYIPLERLEEALGVESRVIIKTYILLLRKGIIKHGFDISRSPAEHIPSLINTLGLEKKLSPVLSQLISFAESIHRDVEFQGKRPKSLAAATIYLFVTMLSYKISQNKVAEAAGVASPTVRRTLSQIIKKMDITIEI